MRYFKVELAMLNAIRLQIMEALGQPNGRASEPWPEGGSFNDGTHGYVALGEHHITEDFAGMFENFLALPGVEEIDAEEYHAAMPIQEPREA